MDSSPASKTQVSRDTLETLSVTSLLERGIEYFQQERYVEGMTLLTLVNEHLTPDQAHLATLLDVVAIGPLDQETLVGLRFRLSETVKTGEGQQRDGCRPDDN